MRRALSPLLLCPWLAGTSLDAFGFQSSPGSSLRASAALGSVRRGLRPRPR